MRNSVGASVPDQALVPAASSPQAVSTKGFDPSREDWLFRFVKESNRIEGIKRTTAAHIRAHVDFLSSPVTPNSLIVLVAILQPDARFRNTYTIPGVRVGSHVAPASGPRISTELHRVLAIHDPWEQHIAYETLHPFTDGNGRSGRALWLHRHHHESFDGWATRRGFLHSFYYHTLSSVRLASGMSASGQDPQGLEAKPASPTPVGGDAQPSGGFTQ